MEASKRRLFVVAGHFDAGGRSQSSSSIPTQQLQELLDHDSIELRRRMKEFMKDDIYIPWVARAPSPRCLPSRIVPEGRARRAHAPRWRRAGLRLPPVAAEPRPRASARRRHR
jgi:hypothetical protein